MVRLADAAALAVAYLLIPFLVLASFRTVRPDLVDGRTALIVLAWALASFAASLFLLKATGRRIV